MRDKQQYTLAAIYDTETTNIYSGSDSRAFPCLFIVNDIRYLDLYNYQPDSDDDIKFFRRETEMVAFIEQLIEWGKSHEVVPIIAAYNLMFDMQPLMQILASSYKMHVIAQSSTHVYTLDILDENEEPILRFWDTFYLEMRGLAAMGETCGIAKACGSWDYSLIRTPDTPLTDEELYYAARDVQVIPAYLKYLLHSNEWLKPEAFGVNVLTKTSLVRQFAKKRIGNIKYDKKDGKKLTQTKMFQKTCMQELAQSFEFYGTRKACFRGGLTFTSARYACQVVNNVASLDVTSMHHAFINGRYLPVRFKPANVEDLENAYDYIVNRVTMADVLETYHKPFYYAFHAAFKFTNIRIKKNTCFDEWGIAILPSAKFRTVAPVYEQENVNNESNEVADTSVRLSGYIDKAENPTFAFGKLYKADKATIYVSEIELFALSRVYEWDSVECISGEIATKFVRPPDYVTLQSNLLFGMKTDMKTILKKYKEGEPYTEEIPHTVPDGIAEQLKAGTITTHFLESYYISTVKGQFNSIYGTMAQDIYKPDFTVDSEGDIYVDVDTKVTKDNWDTKQPEYCKVLYTYGLRIVGGSRLHLIIAMELLYNKFKDKIIVTGGDTDSLKISCAEDITDGDLMDALKPLHEAITNAIDFTMQRVRSNYDKYASTLDDIGCFEVESCGGSNRYPVHMEAWNKARVSIDVDGKVHFTCAGLSRPEGSYNIECFVNDLLQDCEPEKVLPYVLGFNEFVQPCLSFSLETHRPKPVDIFTDFVTDYLGNTTKVIAHESNALYASGRFLGDLTKSVNRDSVLYVREKYNRVIDDSLKILDLDENGNPVIYSDGAIYMKGIKHA